MRKYIKVKTDTLSARKNTFFRFKRITGKTTLFIRIKKIKNSKKVIDNLFTNILLFMNTNWSLIKDYLLSIKSRRILKPFISRKNLRSIYLDNPIKPTRRLQASTLGRSVRFTPIRDLPVYPDRINFPFGMLSVSVRSGKIH